MVREERVPGKSRSGRGRSGEGRMRGPGGTEKNNTNAGTMKMCRTKKTKNNHRQKKSKGLSFGEVKIEFFGRSTGLSLPGPSRPGPNSVGDTRRFRKLSLNCLFAGRNNN